MARVNVDELTTHEVIEIYTSKVFRPVIAETPPIPASYDGKYVVACLIATDTNPTEAQMDAMETSIEGIAGIHKAFVLIGPARIPLDRVPVDHDLTISAKAGFEIRRAPEE